MLQTGLRLSDLTQLTCQDVQLGPGAHLRCHGKSRKDRCTPLTAQTVAVLHVWLRERQGGPTDPLFPGHRGSALSPDAVQRLVSRYGVVAQRTCPSLRDKRVTPHVLRHTCAMQLLQAGVDTSVIALWLGPRSVETTCSAWSRRAMAWPRSRLGPSASPTRRRAFARRSNACRATWRRWSPTS